MSELHPHEAATIQSFILSHRRERWRTCLANAKRRATFLDCLNHCRDFDPRFVIDAPSEIWDTLQRLGASKVCWVISDSTEMDGREMPLDAAMLQAETLGWGTLLCCTPGKLAYYVDEAGTERRWILHRK